MSKVNMSYCMLCLENQASSIKSHIFSHFFIKSMLNPIGHTRRGVGRSFQISGISGTTAFFERDVSMKDNERIFESYELSEKQERNLKMDPYSKAYILCSHCEDRIGIIEDYFNDNVYTDLFRPERIKGNISIQDSNTLLIKLFFLSLIWRASIAKFDNFKFPEEIEERLRNILNISIGVTLEETAQLAQENSGLILKERIFCATTRFFCDITANQVFIENYDQPYFFEVNEYSICYFPTNLNMPIEYDLFGLEKYINETTINFNEENFKICVIEGSEWNSKRHKIIEKKLSELYNNIKSRFIQEYIKQNSNKPDATIVKEFLNDLVNGENTTLALRYSEARIMKLITKHSDEAQ